MRDVIPGGMGRVVGLSEKLSPRLTDKYMERTMFDSQKTDIEASADRPSNLYEPVEHDGGDRGQFQGRVRKWSAYTEAALHPRITTGIVAGLGAIAAGVRRWRASRDNGQDGPTHESDGPTHERDGPTHESGGPTYESDGRRR
jgi:hypothetical protein